MAGRKCGYNGCNNPIKSTEERCHLHVGMAEEGSTKVTSLAEVEEMRRRREAIPAVLLGPPTLPPVLSLQQARMSMIESFTPIAPELVNPVVRATDDVSRGRDMSVPDNSGVDTDRQFETFVSALRAHGVERERMSVMRVSGFNRMVPGKKGRLRQQKSREAMHEVVVLDRGLGSEVAVDPFISMFAPVKDRTLPIETQLDSGSTPFADSPWVGTVGEYAEGAYMWWDRAEFSDID